MVTDDVDLPLDPALPSGAIGGQHIDLEAVVAGERDRLRMQRHRFARRHVPADHGLRPVVDDGGRNTAVVRERPGVGGVQEPV
jgi:hypothetical protein